MRVIHGCYFVSSGMKTFERITNCWWRMYSSIYGKEIRTNFSLAWYFLSDNCSSLTSVLTLFFSRTLRRSELMSEIFTSLYRRIWTYSRETGRNAELSDSLSLEPVTSILNRYSIWQVQYLIKKGVSFISQLWCNALWFYYSVSHRGN